MYLSCKKSSLVSLETESMAPQAKILAIFGVNLLIFAGYADDTADMKTGISTILFSCDKLIFDNFFLHLQCQNQTIYY